MSDIAIKVENLSKLYQLGEVGTGTISHDLNRWWAKMRGKEDPYVKIGQTNDRTKKAESDFMWALKDINFEVKQGEVLGIIGRNGAGKSTLLKILSKITSPTTGKIYTKGRIASLLEVGTGFHPEMTGRENIFMNGAILGMRRCEIEKKFDDIVDFAGVEAYIDTPVKRYSSGMYVRLAFAVAAFLEPEILIVDEVLAVGDAEFQKKCLGRMKDVSVNDGRTVLFVSHNIGAVKTLCNNGVLLENGFLKSYGDITKIIEIYQNNKDNILSVKNEFINIKQLPVFINKVELLVNGKKPVNGVVDFLDQLSFNVYLNVTKKVKNRGIIIHCNDTHETLFQAFDISAHHEYLEGREIGQYFLNILFRNSFLKEGYYSFDFEVGHFGVGIEQFEKSAIQINVGVLSRNPRFEAATLKRTNRFYIEPTWKYEKLDNYE